MMIERVKTYLLGLQDSICSSLESEDGEQRFREELWDRDAGGGGRTRVLEKGAVFEQAGVNFSHVFGDRLPPSATAARPELAGRSFQALGISLVIHPRNPYIPTSHANVRFFIASKNDARDDGAPGNEKDIWWFGGGYDLTPYYPYMDDVIHWRQKKPASHLEMTSTPATRTAVMSIFTSNTATRPVVSADCSSTI